MELQNLEIGKNYKKCPVCGEYAEARKTRCDSCKHILEDDFFLLTKEVYDELLDEADAAKNAEAEAAKNSEPDAAKNSEPDAAKNVVIPQYICSRCGKLYESGSFCTEPGCGGILMPNIAAEDNTESTSKLSGANGDNNTGAENKSVARIRYGFKAYRFEKGEKIESSNSWFPLDKEFAFNRSTLYSDERFFFSGLTVDEKKAVAERFATIKREHCKFFPENGKLYLQLMDERASVRINGKKVIGVDPVELSDTDNLLIGKQGDRDRNILLTIDARFTGDGSIGGTINAEEIIENVKINLDKQINTAMTEVNEKLHHIEGEVAEVKNVLLTVQNAHKKENEDAEQYLSRIMETVEDESTTGSMTTEERICQFLKFDGNAGPGTVDYSGEYYAVRHRAQVEMYFRKAAFLEKFFDEMEHEEDYSEMMIVLGKAFEEIVSVVYLDMIKRTNKAEFDKAVRDNKQGRHISFGFMTRYLANGSARRIWEIVEAAGLPHEQKYFDEVKRMAKQLTHIADVRNAVGGHPPGSGESWNERDREEYYKDNICTIYKREDYYKEKREWFCHRTLQTLTKYHDLIANRAN